MDKAGTETLFDALVGALTPILRSVAPFTLSRLLFRAGIVNRQTMTTGEFEAAIPTVEKGLGEMLKPQELHVAMESLREVLQQRK